MPKLIKRTHDQRAAASVYKQRYKQRHKQSENINCVGQELVPKKTMISFGELYPEASVSAVW